MVGSGVAIPTELAILSEAVESYCLKHGINTSVGRNQVALRVLECFQAGVIDPRELATALETEARSV
ncbi:hypothetical protein [Amaricoccus solimangrovi]|uniref:Uncharacterized protein n=1 Tax=Amaricoccus solimangrovi TaxID=2589815 RepID=A0A501WQN7_9RHOB|nr:hypothetical protein [Amaricoccus solimangrovi]TPE51668.1 hypothetical protein FJM51_08190 [Amaricoccus solimangrovi]